GPNSLPVPFALSAETGRFQKIKCFVFVLFNFPAFMNAELSTPGKLKKRLSAPFTFISGNGEIRTRDTVTRIQTFQACSFNHSDTFPKQEDKFNVKIPLIKRSWNFPVTLFHYKNTV